MIGDAMMSPVDQAVKAIIMEKAKRLKKREYEEHINDVLNDHDIDASEETVEVFLMGAVDAMIYDVGTGLGFRKWKSHQKRKEMLKEILEK
jgi:hypothetical protein